MKHALASTSNHSSFQEQLPQFTHLLNHLIISFPHSRSGFCLLLLSISLSNLSFSHSLPCCFLVKVAQELKVSRTIALTGQECNWDKNCHWSQAWGQSSMQPAAQGLACDNHVPLQRSAYRPLRLCSSADGVTFGSWYSNHARRKHPFQFAIIIFSADEEISKSNLWHLLPLKKKKKKKAPLHRCTAYCKHRTYCFAPTVICFMCKHGPQQKPVFSVNNLQETTGNENSI